MFAGRPAGDSDDSEDEFGGFSFGGEVKTFKQQMRETNESNIHNYKNRVVNETTESRLYNAIVNGNLSVVKEELDNGTDINIKLVEDYTPLLLAASHSKAEIVEELLKREADILTHRDGFNSLMAVCSCNPYLTTSDQVLEVVKLLIDHNLDAKAIDRKRHTALMFASTQGFPDVVNFLTKHSRIDMEDNQGWTALFYAVNNNQPTIAKILIDAGSDLDHIDHRMNNIYYYIDINELDDIKELFPKDEEFLPTPDELVDKLTPLETMFDLWNPSREGIFEQDISVMLYGAQCENLISIFKERNISLYDFLSCTDEELKEMDVKLQFQRDRIMMALYKFHKHKFANKSIPTVKDAYSTYDMLITVANSVKHLTAMEASLKYIEKNVKFDELKAEKIGPIADLNRAISSRLRSLNYLSTLLKKTAIQLDAVIPNQPDLISKDSKFRKYSFKFTALKLVTVIGVASVSIVICLRLR